MSPNPTATPLDDEQPLDTFANCHKGIVTRPSALGEPPTRTRNRTCFPPYWPTPRRVRRATRYSIWCNS
jgi:hypothetical protein